MVDQDLPRAVSTDPANARHAAWIAAGCPQIAVWLDGELQASVDTYDIDEGFIVRAVLTGDGAIQLTEARDAVKVERVDGVVTVARIEATPAGD